MAIWTKTFQKVDSWQQSHKLSAFLVAVIKKYDGDHSGRRAALLTYYSFLSIFPLILFITTLATLLGGQHSTFRHDVVSSISDYFPVLGSQLSNHISTLHKNGPALLISLLVILYGTRGVAAIFKEDVQHIWQAHQKQSSFVWQALSNIRFIIIGGLGFLLASILTGLTATAGHGEVFRVLSIIIDFAILYWLFVYLLNASLPSFVPSKELRAGALTATVGLIILQLFGSYLLKKELKHLDALYSSFALSLGLLFWVYLQAQLLYYAVTIAAVKNKRLWPRSLLASANQ